MNDSPKSVVTIPIKVVMEGSSFKNIKESIPVAMSGPARSITDNTIGESLFSDAKKKQSPSVIPTTPLAIKVHKYSGLMNKFARVNKAIIASKMAQ